MISVNLISLFYVGWKHAYFKAERSEGTHIVKVKRNAVEDLQLAKVF